MRSALETSIGAIRSVTPVGGGDIAEAARVETRDVRYFVKWSLHPRPRMFEAEARGLNQLASAKALRTPRVVAVMIVFVGMLYWAFRRSKRKVTSLKEEVPAGNA